jgi:hypothetical protein
MEQKTTDGGIRSRMLIGCGAAFCAFLICLEGALTTRFFLPFFALLCIAGVAHIFSDRKPDSLLRRLLIVVIVSGLTLCAADLALRPFFKYGRPQRVSRQDHAAKLLSVAPEYFGDTIVINVTTKKDEYGDLLNMGRIEDNSEYRVIELRFDSYGYRNNEPSGPPPIYDAIVLGDSFGYGKGTTQEKIWPRLLETRYGLKTYNLSKNAGDPWDEFLTLDSEIGRLKTWPGTTVVWAICASNDLSDMGRYDDIPAAGRVAGGMSLRRFRDASPVRLLFFLALRPVLGDSIGKPPRGREPASKILGGADMMAPGNVISKKVPSGKSMLFFKPYIASGSYSYGDVAGSGQFAKIKATMALMKQLADKKQLKVKIVLIPGKEEVYSWVAAGGAPWTSPKSPAGFSRALSKAARANGMEFLDLKPYMIEASKNEYESSGRLLWWRNDTHVNETGHALIAKLVYENLISRGRKTAAN